MAVRAFGPGRVNLVGEHTDYNDGLCLPFAIALGVTVTATDGPPGRVRVLARDLGEEDEFALDAPGAAGGWRAFARGIVAELGPGLRPATLTIEATLAQGAGLSSSAALEVALALALLQHSGVAEPDRRELARLCSRVENDWVGARTGLLDQLAALFGQADAAIRIDMRDLAITPVPLELGDWTLVTVDSGARHTHASSGYNERRAECRRACELLGVASLRDATHAGARGLPDPLDRRALHVLEENARVETAVAALHHGAFDELGRGAQALRGGRGPDGRRRLRRQRPGAPRPRRPDPGRRRGRRAGAGRATAVIAP